VAQLSRVPGSPFPPFFCRPPVPTAASPLRSGPRYRPGLHGDVGYLSTWQSFSWAEGVIVSVDALNLGFHRFVSRPRAASCTGLVMRGHRAAVAFGDVRSNSWAVPARFRDDVPVSFAESLTLVRAVVPVWRHPPKSCDGILPSRSRFADRRDASEHRKQAPVGSDGFGKCETNG